MGVNASRKTLLLAALAAVVGGNASRAQDMNYEPCLDYSHVGMAGCGEDSPRKPKVPVKPKVSPTVLAPVAVSPAVVASTGKTLDQRIDEFLENQGKPPREFVAFYLEPTPENALKWAYAYQEIQDRNMKITEAWTQAEQAVMNAQLRGVDVSSLASTSLPPVMPVTGPIKPWWNTRDPAFPTGDQKKLMEARKKSQPSLADTVKNLSGLGNEPVPPIPATLPSASLGGGATAALPSPMPSLAAAPTPVVPPTPALPTQTASSGPALRISYYFSAACEYCHRFEPEFASMIKEMPQTQVTCVDITEAIGKGPATEANIQGKLPCTWRKVAEGELESMGIKTTPTLIVDRGGGQSLQRVNGYIEPAKLKTWLITGKPGA